jgi:hypothetical protein
MARVAYCYNYLYKLPSGKTISVTNRQWGLLALTGTELTNFKSEMEAIAVSEQAQVDAGELVISELGSETESAGDGPGTYDSMGGKKYTFPNLNEDPTWHANYYNWTDQMVADSNVVFRPLPDCLVITP